MEVWGDPVYAQQLTEMSILWNGLLQKLPARFPHAKIQISDTFGLLKMVQRFPRLFGFKNTTEACYRDWTDGALCSNPDEYWYWDYSHPSTHAHKLLTGLSVKDVARRRTEGHGPQPAH